MAPAENAHPQGMWLPDRFLSSQSNRKDQKMANTEDLKDFLGIPRKLIPWFPIIDDELCSDCGLCVKACKHGTYAYRDDSDKVVVANPYHCEVYCESCRFQCPVGAISFPDRKGIKLIFKELRRQYPPAA
jgi:NAD-dependent dihydropyrimidine dehydrogenase PreA subunit